MNLPPPSLRDYLRGRPGRCDECYWHVPTMGHQIGCTVGPPHPDDLVPVTAFAVREDAFDAVSSAHPKEAHAVDQVLGEFIRRGKPFSANDYHDRLSHIQARNVIGARVNAAAKARHIKRVGYVPSTDPAAKGRPVAVWQPV